MKALVEGADGRMRNVGCPQIAASSLKIPEHIQKPSINNRFAYVVQLGQFPHLFPEYWGR